MESFMKSVFSLTVAALLMAGGSVAMAQNYKKDADNHARAQQRAAETTRKNDNARINSNTQTKRYEATRDTNKRR
jgi:PBP1b-binding outer membrane lipoprotein LpoB